MRVSPRNGRLQHAIVRAGAAGGLGLPAPGRGLLRGDFIILDSPDRTGRGEPPGSFPVGVASLHRTWISKLSSATGAAPAAAGVELGRTAISALDDTAHGTGHQRLAPGGPRARASTWCGHRRRRPPGARVADPRGTWDLVLIVAGAHGPWHDTTTAAHAATTSATTASDSAVGDSDVSVCVQVLSSFTAAALRR